MPAQVLAHEKVDASGASRVPQGKWTGSAAAPLVVALAWAAVGIPPLWDMWTARKSALVLFS